MTDRPHQLVVLDVGDAPGAWRAAGFSVDDDGVVLLGRTGVRCTGAGGAVLGWRLDGVDADVDGLPTAPPPAAGSTDAGGGSGPAPAHPNGISGIDHVVVRTGDVDRTVAVLEAAGLAARGGRSTTSYGAPMRQSFHWAGDVIVEVVGPDVGEPTTDEPTTWFGLALVADDLDATAAALGPLMGEPRPAVQDGRRIAGLRGREVGMAVPVVVMSPHPRAPG